MDGNDWVLVATRDEETWGAAARLFRRAGLLTRRVGSGEAALAAIDQETPDLMIIDLTLDDASGYEICYEIKQRFGQRLPVVMLSEDRTEPKDRVAGLLIGADDYLAKPFDPDELLARARRLLAESQQLDARRDFELTPREAEVLLELAGGLGRQSVAKKLSISPKTVATHVQNILTKLGVHSSAEAVALAFRSGLIRR
jgi:DNA-binding NarL/FixJ family response regulator